MSDAWERLCEAVGAKPEKVFAGYRLIDAGFAPRPLLAVMHPFALMPTVPAYLRRPNRKRWRGILRAALGPQWARGWRYFLGRSLGRDHPHVAYVERLREQHETIQHGNLSDAFCEPTDPPRE